MKSEQEFEEALAGKKVPILVLDQKWHRLFAIHGKTDAIKSLEAELKDNLAKQGQLNSSLKELKKLKAQLMNNIVENMDDTTEGMDEKVRQKKLDEDKRLIDEINEKIANCEDELMELPKEIQTSNQKLMIESMDYCYSKLRVNQEEAKDIEEWINQIRVELKKNIIRKQNRTINNREIYSYMHDIFGPDVLNLFDLKYEEVFQDNKNKEKDGE